MAKTIREIAEICGVSKQTINIKIKGLGDSVKPHISRQANRILIDDKGVKLILSSMGMAAEQEAEEVPAPAAEKLEALADEVKALKDENERLTAEADALKSECNRLQDEKLNDSEKVAYFKEQLDYIKAELAEAREEIKSLRADLRSEQAENREERKRLQGIIARTAITMKQDSQTDAPDQPNDAAAPEPKKGFFAKFFG